MCNRSLTCFKEYSAGIMMTGDLKKRAIDVVSKLIEQLQSRRTEVTDDTVKMFTTVRQFNCFNKI